MATTSLGRLTLDLVAQIGQFTEPLSQAERKAREASRGIAESFNVSSLAAKAFGAVVAGASLASVVAFANETINAGNEIKKFSQLANTSTSQFQYYAKGAETAGISIESFADKMKDMQDRIGDFQQTGGGPLADFFTNIAPKVGVTIQQFQKLSGPEALQLYYNSLEKVGASQNDMKFYMEAIISDSSLLIPLLKNGGEGFKFWGDAAQKAGAIMSDDTVKSLAEAKTSLQLMELQWQGLEATLVNNIIPVVQTVVDHMDDVKAVAVALGAVIATKLAISISVMTYQLAPTAIFAIRAGVGLVSLAGSATVASGAMTVLKGAMAFLGGPAGLAMLAFQGLAAGAAFLYMRKKSDEVKPSLDSQKLSIEELIEKYNELGEAAKRNQQRAESTKMTDLSNSYDDAKSKMVSLVVAMGRFDDSSADAVKKANQLAMEYKQGKLTTEQLAQQINALSGVSEEAKSKIDAQAGAVSTAKNEMEQQREVVAALVGKNKQLSGSSDQVTSSINAQAQAYLNLTQKQREALNDIKSNLLRDKYISTNMALGWSRDKAEFYANYREKTDLGYEGKVLSSAEKSILEQGYKLTLTTKAREESEKKTEDAKRKQLEHDKKLAEEAAKKYSYTVKEEAMLRRVAEISAKNDLNGIGDKYGIPKNLLAAMIAQESKGDINAKSPTGAIGPGQTTSIFRKQYSLSVADSYDVKKVADAMSRDLAKSYEVFGNWEDAVTAYNAGVKGTQSLLKNGFTGSVEKTKEAKEYAQKVNKWFVGLSGADAKDSGFYGEKQSDSLKEYQAYLDKTEQLRVEALARQVTIAQKYASDEQQIHLENAEAIKSISEAFTVDDSNRQKYLDLQKIAYEKDLREFEKNQEAKRLAAYNSLNDPIYAMRDKGVEAIANFAMTPMQKQQWQLNNEQQDGYSSLANDLGLARSAIEDNELLNDQQKYEQLENAYATYLQNKAHLDAQYDQQSKDLVKSQHESQLQVWSSLLSQGQTMWAQLTQSVKDANGEQSGAYKAMFLAQQTFSMGSAYISAVLASTQVAADATIPFFGAKIAASKAMLALGMANVGMIAAQTITGMAHDGIANIPEEGTWLLNKGERVLNPQDNKAFTNMINNGGSGGDITIQVNVTDSGVSTSGGNTQDQRQLAQVIGNTVRAVIIQEKRQGGLLSK